MPPETLSWGDWTQDTASSDDIDISGDGQTFELAPKIPDSTVLHLDAREVAATDGDTLSTWRDQSDAGNDLTGGSPTYTADVQNGNPVLRFSGGDYLDNSTPAVSQPITWMAVIKTTGNGREAIGSTTNDADQRAQYRYDDGDYAYFHGDTTVKGGSTDTNFHVLTHISDGANSVLRVDGTEVVSGDAGPHTWGGLRIGNTYSGNEPHDGDQAEHLVCDANLSSTGELAEQEQRLADGWGITLA